MTIEGFLRMAWPYPVGGAVATLIALFVVYLITHEMTSESVNAKYIVRVRRAGKWFVRAVWLAVGITILVLAAQNLFPRTRIDTTNTEQQNQSWEQRHSNPPTITPAK